MVATTEQFSDPRYRTQPGEGLDGVVRVSFGAYYATGTLLFDGRVVLTAAHLFEGVGSTARVTFETRDGIFMRDAARILQHPGYDGQTNHDLALVWLADPAPVAADRYDIYRDGDEIGQIFTFSGYGLPGTGATGTVDTAGDWPLRLQAANRFDADAASLASHLGAVMDWRPLVGGQLVSDFDDGTQDHDALGRLIGRYDPGLGRDEGVIAPGDSGAPAFIEGRVAGVASYLASLSLGEAHPDIDDRLNSSFGEVAGWQRVSTHQQWIDQSLRAHYPGAPTQPGEVERAVVEGDSDTSLAYFLVQFTGVRSDPEQVLSVDYATRDGTAEAGSDYLPTSGTLNLYPDENQAAIPVEIIGDTMPEPVEYFYLDVFNPVGGGFGEGVVKLTAVRTLLDDDGWLG